MNEDTDGAPSVTHYLIVLDTFLSVSEFYFLSL